MNDYHPVESRPRRRWLRKTLIASTSLLLGAGATLFYLVRSEPAHWQEHQRFVQTTSPQQREQMVRNIEQRLSAMVFAPVAPQTPGQGPVDSTQAQQPELVAAVAYTDKPVIKTLFLTTDEVNAYVAEKFHEWLTYRDYEMPEGLSQPAIGIEDGRMMVSFEFSSHGFSQVFTAGFDIRFVGGAKAELRLRDVAAGKLSIAPDGIGEHLRKHGPDSDKIRKAADWLDKLDLVEFKPSMKLGASHKAHIIAYKVHKDGLMATVKIMPRKSPGIRSQIAAVAID